MKKCEVPGTKNTVEISESDVKGIFRFAMIFIMLFLLVKFCAFALNQNAPETSVRVYVDLDNGVNYLIYDGLYGTGMCPRYNADGTLYVEEGQIED